MKTKVEDLIKQYIHTIIGVDCVDVEIIEDTVVLSREERWHIYIIPGNYTMIGCFVDEDITLSELLRKNASSIYHIYETYDVDETV